MNSKLKKQLGCTRHIDKSIKEIRGKSGKVRNVHHYKQQPGICEVTRRDKDGNIIKHYSFMHRKLD